MGPSDGDGRDGFQGIPGDLMMSGRDTARNDRPPRGLTPSMEDLDRRDLPAAGAGPSLGSFLAPGTTVPKVAGVSAVVVPRTAVNEFLSNELGPGIASVQTTSEAHSQSANNLVASTVVNQTLIHAILSKQDTYDLLSQTLADSNDAAGGAYSATGTILQSALNTATHTAAPNAPHSVPGLRLAGAFAKDHNFAGSQASGILRAFRVAVSRDVLNLSASQQNTVAADYAQFVSNVQAMQTAGTFTPSVPPPAPTLPAGPLSGTIEVSLGAFRNLTGVDASQSGLPLPDLGNFPGRIDVGFVIDRNGNFGIVLTATGPFAGVPQGVSSANVIGGDISVEVSNAANINNLTGTRLVEGLNQGTGISGGLETATTTTGVSTFSASIGNGSGLEFGTGIAYTQVIPLGNAFALIPEYPKTSS